MPKQKTYTPTEDWHRLIENHRFHNPLRPDKCYLCDLEVYRSEFTPTERWVKAVNNAFNPPPIIKALTIVILLQAAIIAAVLAS